MALLKMNLIGPLQSYGVRGRWDYRDTLEYPTKSAVSGMLGCALGIPRERLEEVANQIKVHIRVNKAGRISEDYQIREYKPTLSSEKKKFVLHKYYLNDASFTVYIDSTDEFIDKCYTALLDPVWPIFLGRKCCIPSELIVSRDKSKHVFTEIDNISDFITKDALFDRNSGIVKEDYLKYFIEDTEGSINLYTQVSNKGQKFYKQVRLKEYLKGWDDVSNQDSDKQI